MQSSPNHNFRQWWIQRLAAVLFATGLLGIAGCSMSRFDDLKDQVPALRLGQRGSIQSDFFGRLVLGLPAPTDLAGGQILLAGTGGNPALNTIRIDDAGNSSSKQSSLTQYETDLGLGTASVRTLAPAPSSAAVGALEGPFVYLGTNDTAAGRVVIADALEYTAVDSALTPSDSATATDFGASLAPFHTTDAEGDTDGLLIGGRGRVWLYGFSAWPTVGDHVVVDAATADWPDPSSGATSATFTVATAGDLNSNLPGDEIVVAAPGLAYVAILYAPTGWAACLADRSACGVLQVPAPSGADDFGKALLITDLDGDGQTELVVGAPGANSGVGAVFVYSVEAHPATATPPIVLGTPAALEVPEGSEQLGAALAYGTFGGGDQPLLAAGAPGTTVDDAASAGRIVLYAQRAESPTLDVAVSASPQLLSPNTGELLGGTLTTMPFRVGDTTHQVLVSGGDQAAIVLFSNLVPGQQDPRAR